MTYKTIITRLFALEGLVPGYTPEAIAAAERRLGCMLPDVLRDYYLTLGRNKALNATHNRLLEPEEIYFSGSGHLVFYEENQAVAVWGIAAAHLAQEDPPVWGAYDMDREEWFEDAGAITDFLLSMAYSQAAMGGLPFSAFAESVSPNALAAIEQHWTEQVGLTRQYLRFFTHDHHEILLLTTDELGKPGSLYVAANNKNAYRRIMALDNMVWDDQMDN